MPTLTATIESVVLRDNPMGDPAVRKVVVCLPPEYEWDGRRFPVVYFLPGFASRGTMLLNEAMWDETLPQRVDRLIRDGVVPPIIVVIPDCATRLGGSQYINSTATGRYEDFLVEELVPWVDSQFRTVPGRNRRALMGKSSGGYGATVLAMRHPELFSIAVDHSGDKYFEHCYGADIPRVVAGLAPYGASAATFLKDFPHPPEQRGSNWFDVVNMLAMASAYSPSSDSEIGFELPFDERTGEIRPPIWQRWKQNDPVELLATHSSALKSLRYYYLDCGSRDEHHLHLSARIYTKHLEEVGVRFRYDEFDGGHRNTAHRYARSLTTIAQFLTE